MVEAKTKDIDGFKVTVTTLTALRSLKLMHKLVRAIGPGLLRSLAGVKGDASGAPSLASVDVSALAEGAQAILDRLSENDLEETVKTLFDNALLERGGKTGPFLSSYEMAYSGNMPALLRTIQFGLEANYGNFFAALRSALPSVTAAAPVAPA